MVFKKREGCHSRGLVYIHPFAQLLFLVWMEGQGGALWRVRLCPTGVCAMGVGEL